MGSYKKNKLRLTMMLVLFVIGVILQIVGIRYKGYKGLTIQLISLAMLVWDLYLYNQKYV